MVGGMVSATVLTLVVVPAVYGLWKGIGLPYRPVLQKDKDKLKNSTGGERNHIESK